MQHRRSLRSPLARVSRRFAALLLGLGLSVCTSFAQQSVPPKEKAREEVQPYVIIDREALQATRAANAEEFLAKRTAATADASKKTPSQLILVDGRKPTVNLKDVLLTIIERIEIMPASDSAIYGGDARGGVINIILRRGAAEQKPKQ